MLGQPEQERAHQERLVGVVADVFQLDDDVARNSLSSPGGDRRRRTGRPCPWTGWPTRTETKPRTFAATSAPYPASTMICLGGVAQVGQGGPAWGDTRGAGFAEGEVPAGVGVAAVQRGGQDLRERLAGAERGHEQSLDHVSVGTQRKPGCRLKRVESDRDRVRVTHPHHGHVSRHVRAVLGFGGFDHQPRPGQPGWPR